jgi:cytochrome c556
MRFPVGIVGVATAMFVSGMALIAAQSSHAASGDEVINARIDFMKEDLGGHWRTLAAFAKGGKGTLADVEKAANAIASTAKKIPTHFPKDTGRGKYPDSLTRSLPAIWTDWAKFEKEVQRLVDGSTTLARLAREGNKEAVVSTIGASGSYARTSIGCAECHKAFRGPAVK